jgi:ribosomal protein S27AE
MGGQVGRRESGLAGGAATGGTRVSPPAKGETVVSVSEQPVEERRRQRRCPSCGATGMIRGCRVPGVQIQVITDEGDRISGPISLYSDVCVECGLTSFYARRDDVGRACTSAIEELGTELE